jgi:hypothetical protein
MYKKIQGPLSSFVNLKQQCHDGINLQPKKNHKKIHKNTFLEEGLKGNLDMSPATR